MSTIGSVSILFVASTLMLGLFMPLSAFGDDVFAIRELTAVLGATVIVAETDFHVNGGAPPHDPLPEDSSVSEDSSIDSSISEDSPDSPDSPGDSPGDSPPGESITADSPGESTV